MHGKSWVGRKLLRQTVSEGSINFNCVKLVRPPQEVQRECTASRSNLDDASGMFPARGFGQLLENALRGEEMLTESSRQSQV
jgi:hypothetical protein